MIDNFCTRKICMNQDITRLKILSNTFDGLFFDLLIRLSSHKSGDFKVDSKKNIFDRTDWRADDFQLS
ncbi:MAG: hypothetical protein ACD_2C00014G0002 [uncultured bacterium (gcode 4)]|uniref:Uncharacterized protein n=1 Tax=uncultured bacterium (gcode 4) TaxID=1234023 RepID=K2G4U5_9BACT|nr:MAG: hypothetical protein ACD_2C00014G0002 [uncultured bacterium (gcode 4)]